MANHTHWFSLWQRLDLSKEYAQQAYQNLVLRYAEPHRHYHNLHHIEQVLQEFAFVSVAAKAPELIELAIWFHDAVYDTHRNDNEEQSSALAAAVLKQAGLASAKIDHVQSLILATKHNANSGTEDEAILCDADLAILGKSTAVFDQYEKAVRLEYAWVPEVVFWKKRGAILEMFLKKNRIYQSGFFFDRYESTARQNLRATIDRQR